MVINIESLWELMTPGVGPLLTQRAWLPTFTFLVTCVNMLYIQFAFIVMGCKKVQVGNDQEKAKSERNSNSNYLQQCPC